MSVKITRGENRQDLTCDHCDNGFKQDGRHVKVTFGDHVVDLHDDCALAVGVDLIQVSESTWPSDEDDV